MNLAGEKDSYELPINFYYGNQRGDARCTG